jgi:hypothetical protein
LRFLALIITLIISSGNISAQKVYLNIKGNSSEETKTIDSIGYTKAFTNAKEINTTIATFSNQLLKIGFIESEIVNSEKSNDSTFQFTYHLKTRTTHLHIYIDPINQNSIQKQFPITNQTVKIPIEATESFLNTVLTNLENKGSSLSKITLINFRKHDNKLFADLLIKDDQSRKLTSIIVNGYNKFPSNHLNNINKQYKNQIFNQKTVEKIYNEFEKYPFIKQIKYPEILFTKDSTKVYIYVEKARSNTFDGFIGFSNNENKKLAINGYLDLTLSNSLQGGEKFELYWKGDENKQTTFNASLEIPYLFKSPLALKTQLNIFKRDSIFQNTTININLGYYFKYNKKLYIGYQATESNDIQNTNNSTISDFKNNFLTSTFEYTNFQSEIQIFPIKSTFEFKIGTGKRNSKTQSTIQQLASLNAFYNFNINNKNIINLKTQNYYLISNDYITNELYRFGGINSIRGFNENTLQGNLFTSILSEYRYLASKNLYIHSILDYGYQQDKTTKTTNKLLGLGAGIGITTNNGLINIVYANGSQDNQEIKLSNSIIHINFKSVF